MESAETTEVKVATMEEKVINVEKELSEAEIQASKAEVRAFETKESFGRTRSMRMVFQRVLSIRR